jgi:hypothetical protein
MRATRQLQVGQLRGIVNFQESKYRAGYPRTHLGMSLPAGISGMRRSPKLRVGCCELELRRARAACASDNRRLHDRVCASAEGQGPRFLQHATSGLERGRSLHMRLVASPWERGASYNTTGRQPAVASISTQVALDLPKLNRARPSEPESPTGPQRQWVQSRASPQRQRVMARRGRAAFEGA